MQGTEAAQHGHLEVEALAKEMRAPGSAHTFLAEQRDRMFPDWKVADWLSSSKCRRWIPVSVTGGHGPEGSGLTACPADSCYALGAQWGNLEALDRIRSIRGLDSMHHFTLVCKDFALPGQCVMADKEIFRSIKAVTPEKQDRGCPHLGQ